jgi:hypothetical protein
LHAQEELATSASLEYRRQMTKLEKIEQDIASLSKADLKDLSKWLDEFNADVWDKQIEDDAAAGKLDKLISAAKAQAAAGKVRPL